MDTHCLACRFCGWVCAGKCETSCVGAGCVRGQPLVQSLAQPKCSQTTPLTLHMGLILRCECGRAAWSPSKWLRSFPWGSTGRRCSERDRSPRRGREEETYQCHHVSPPRAWRHCSQYYRYCGGSSLSASFVTTACRKNSLHPVALNAGYWCFAMNRTGSTRSTEKCIS